MSKKFIYAGPSWAVLSYDTPQGDPDTATNLLELWELTEVAINISQRASHFDRQLTEISKYDSSLPVVYVSCETLSVFNGKQYIVPGLDVWRLRQDINLRNMQALAQLDNPVAVIGAHTDITDCSVTVIDSSWQNFLCRTAGLPEQYNWGAEVLHRHLHHTEFRVVDDEMIDCIHDQFAIWRELEKQKLMCWCHPTTLGNQLYAAHIEDTVKEFLNV